MDWSRVPHTHRFVPLGFEADGAFGQATLDFLREVEVCDTVNPCKHGGTV